MRCILFITPIDKQPRKLIKLISVDYPIELDPIRSEKVNDLENCCSNRHRIMYGHFIRCFAHVSVMHTLLYFIYLWSLNTRILTLTYLNYVHNTVAKLCTTEHQSCQNRKHF